MHSSVWTLALLAASIGCGTAAHASRIDLKPGLVIGHSASVVRKTYSIPNADETGQTAAITVKGDGLIVDFAGACLEGAPRTAEPDSRAGTAIKVIGKNVTIKNLKARGYKIGLVAFDAPGIKVLNSDLSYNWKQHLGSGLDREDEADWMSYHHNEKDEWLGYGAGIYLRRCDGFEVKGVTITGGQCGLMLMECNKGLAYNNDFSFLSGIGLGMYRCSDNRIMHNRIDWCVRGYSHGVYNRGQDSAGILIYEQSCRNTFAYNSVTHGGDGFFLWAGQTTMDTGEGGCNDNLLYGNDFSHAPTNGIEATFSRNTFANNLVMECWHGVWGGYSYDTNILGNIFAYNAESISIEHGQNNGIRGNAFFREGTAIHVWDTEKVDPTWGYGKHRDIASHGYDVSGNLFSQITQGGTPSVQDTGTPLRLIATSDFKFGPNRFGPVSSLYSLTGPIHAFTFAGADAAGEQKASKAEIAYEPASFRQVRTNWSGTLGAWSGYDPANKDRSHSLSGGLLPALMHPSGNVILPYPEGDALYTRRFSTNWNPLKAAAGPVSVGALPQGKSLLEPSAEAAALAPPPLPDGVDPFLKGEAAKHRGRGYILVDHWGPYDFRSPIIWPRNYKVLGSSERFEILGPKGRWQASGIEGGELSAKSGPVPGFVEFTRTGKTGGRVKIELIYTGGKSVDYRGVETPAGKSVAFRYTEFSVPINWHIAFFKYDKNTQEPRTMDAPFRALIASKPLAEATANTLDIAPGRIPREVGNDYFATVSDGDFEIEPGDYLIDTTTDDGARVYLDGKLIVDEWKYQGPTTYTRSVHLGGKHHLHVEHFQIDGYWTLKVGLREKP